MAYEGLAKRTNHPGVKSVATAMIQAERYGTPLGTALRVMAKENRELRLSAAEKKAAALPAKLTVPMIVFFLPCLFVVILGPAAIRVMEDSELFNAGRGAVFTHDGINELDAAIMDGATLKAGEAARMRHGDDTLYLERDFARSGFAAAGEWLERSGMARGRHDADQEIVSVEGVPLKYQRPEALPNNMSSAARVPRPH